MRKFYEEALSEIQDEHSVTIYSPVRNGVREEDKNLSKVLKLISQVEDNLARMNLKLGEIKEITSKATDYIKNNHQFFQPTNTLCLFFSKKGLVSKKISTEVPSAQVTVSKDFSTEYLDKYFEENLEFYLLKINQGSTEFLKVTDDKYQTVDIPGLEQNINNFYNDIEISQELQSHSSSSGANEQIFHGNESENKNFEDKLEKYIKHTAELINKKLKYDDLPLILATGERIKGIYRDYNNYENLLDTSISVNRKHSSVKELSNLAQDLVK